MVKVLDPVLILLSVSCLCSFLLRFLKDGVFKELSFSPLLERWKLGVLSLLPYPGLFALGQHFGVDAASALPYFIAAAAVAFLLGGLNLPSHLRGILQLGGCVALTLIGPPEGLLLNLSAVVVALSAYKILENLCFSKESSFDDLLPSLVWLAGVMWCTSVDTGKTLAFHLNALLGVLAVAYLMRFVQGPFVKVDPRDDRIYLKRVVLSLTAGLGVLIVLVKLLSFAELESLQLSALCGASFFATYWMKNADGSGRFLLNPQAAVKLLIVIGLLTLVATRLFGTFGLLVLAPAALVAPAPGVAALPGLFFSVRVLLQVFLQNYNLNVTGVNLTHQYASAAMYAGLLLAVVLIVFFKEIQDRRLLLTIMVGAGIVVPIMSGFLLHAEPTGSLLISALVGSTLLSVAAPSLQASPVRGTENLLLLPAVMSSTCILTSGLLEGGVEASNLTKLAVLGCGMLLVFLLTLFYWWLFRKGPLKPATQVTGES